MWRVLKKCVNLVHIFCAPTDSHYRIFMKRKEKKCSLLKSRDGTKTRSKTRLWTKKILFFLSFIVVGGVEIPLLRHKYSIRMYVPK